MKLKIFLMEVQGHTLMQVIEQKGLKEGTDFYANSGFNIVVNSEPDIGGDNIHLRGYRKDHDNDLVHIDELVKDNALEALDEFFFNICENYQGHIQEENIYTFLDVERSTLDLFNELLEKGLEPQIRSYLVTLNKEFLLGNL